MRRSVWLINLILALVLLVPTVSVIGAQTAGQDYVIQPGDTLTGLAAQYIAAPTTWQPSSPRPARRPWPTRRLRRSTIRP